MTDLKIVTIGPETIATLGAPWLGGRPVHNAVVALTYPAGDIVAVDVMDEHDNILVERGVEDFGRKKKGAADAVASRVALVAQLVIRGDQYRITAPETIADGNYELP